MPQPVKLLDPVPLEELGDSAGGLGGAVSILIMQVVSRTPHGECFSLRDPIPAKELPLVEEPAALSPNHGQRGLGDT